MKKNNVINPQHRDIKPVGSNWRRGAALVKSFAERVLPALMICLLLALVGQAQSTTQMSHTMVMGDSDAQKIFTTMKTLAGSWQGRMSTIPLAAAPDGKAAQITLRVTSTGNAVMHEVTLGGMPDDPITMFYLDDDRLLLTHYCDAGNRPRMVGKVSADGKSLEFDFLDIVGGNTRGHMHHAVFTIIDTNHHTEDWTYMLPGDKPILAHFDLQRAK